MEHRIETFNPERAQEVLTHAAPPLFPGDYEQRKVDRATVDYYARQMVAGRWTLMPSQIVFRNDGRLMNGSHTLSAIIRAEVSIDLSVTSNCPEYMWKWFDRPKVRSQFFAMDLDPWYGMPCRLLAERLYKGKADDADVAKIHTLLEPYLQSLARIKMKSPFKKHGTVPFRVAAAVRLFSEPELAGRTIILDLWSQHMMGSDLSGMMEAANRRIESLQLTGTVGNTVALSFGWKIFDPWYTRQNYGKKPSHIIIPKDDSVLADLLSTYCRGEARIEAAIPRLRKVG